MDGILVVDKPAGPTSHDVVDRVRKIFGIRKVGHTGTLDPAATGVLGLLLGRATKLSQYLTGSDKAYRAVIRLGRETTTLDAEGKVVSESPVTCDAGAVEEAVAAFVGDITQIPPMFSAKHRGGKRLHELARKGIEVERDPVPVTIHSIEVVAVDLPDVVVDVSCSSGTYVRVLALDLGRALGCGGHLASLRRTAAGPFTIADGAELSALEDDRATARARVWRLDDPRTAERLAPYLSPRQKRT